MARDVIKAAFWGMVGGLAITTLLILGGNGCAASNGSGAESPQRSTARAVNLTVARAVVVADQSCASLALQIKDVKLAKSCADSYDIARPVLLSAEGALDTWDSIAQDQLGCAINSGVSALTQVSALLLSQKVAIPTVVLDALKLVSSVTFTCKSIPVVVPPTPVIDAGGEITVVYVNINDSGLDGGKE